MQVRECVSSWLVWPSLKWYYESTFLSVLSWGSEAVYVKTLLHCLVFIQCACLLQMILTRTIVPALTMSLCIVDIVACRNVFVKSFVKQVWKTWWFDIAANKAVTFSPPCPFLSVSFVFFPSFHPSLFPFESSHWLPNTLWDCQVPAPTQCLSLCVVPLTSQSAEMTFNIEDLTEHLCWIPHALQSQPFSNTHTHTLTKFDELDQEMWNDSKHSLDVTSPTRSAVATTHLSSDGKRKNLMA